MANAFDFGAVGDGVVDDTPALLHALEQGDGVLRLNKGTYRITRTLSLDLTKQGYGAVLGEGGTTRILMDGPGPALRIVGDHRGTAQPRSVQPHVWENERLPTVAELEILGRHPDAVGIELHKTMQTVISRLLVRNCKHGIHLIERNRNVVISDSHLYDNSEYGLFFDHCNLHQIIVHGNHISYNKKGGIKSLRGDVHNLQITGNDIEYNNHPGVDASPNGEPRGAEIWFEAPDGRISEVTIASNTIQATIEPGGANLRIHGSPGEPPLGAVLFAITGNVLGSQTRGIELKYVQRAAITGNTIYGSADLSMLAVSCRDIAVGPNTVGWRGEPSDPPQDGLRFEDCDNCSVNGLVTRRLSAGGPERGAAITLVRCRDMAVTNCQLTDPLYRGVELEDCVRCRVSSNHIVDRRDPPSMREAIRIVGDSRHNLVESNLVGGTAHQPLAIDERTATVRGNLEV